MAYFLKKVNRNGKVYLSIVDSYYDGSRGHTVHKTHSSYGTGEQLVQELGITDPVAYLQEQVDALNANRKKEKTDKITEISPEKFAGHFVIKAILNKLRVEPIINAYDLTTNYHFHLYDVLSSLIFSRCICPCSKYKTFNEVIPHLEDAYNFSYDQLLEGLAWFGDHYEHIVEIFTKLTAEAYGINTSINYFDCTNFYFEIDKEDEERRRGPCKENRNDPILGMGLLLDANQIPIGMKLYPGNQSEKPIIREVINQLKKRNGIETRIVQVADKGLNCAKNIYEALRNGDGYIFSKSCRQLPEIEKTWILLTNDYVDIKDANGEPIYKMKECIDDFTYAFKDEEGKTISFTITEKRVVTYNYALARKQIREIEKLERKANELCCSRAKKEEYGECAKYVDFKGKDGSKATAKINQLKIDEDKKLCGYNMIVTSEIKAKKEEIYKVYHNLWRIEESFRIMKSELDARPVYLKKKETIYGHFLICYLGVLLLRLMQIYELKDEDSYQDICNLFANFKLVQIDNRYISLYTAPSFASKLEKITNIPVGNAIFSKKQYEKMMSYKL